MTPGFEKGPRPVKTAEEERAGMREVETRIVNDIEIIMETFSPENVANRLFAAIREKLIGRNGAMKLNRFNEMGGRVKTSATDAASTAVDAIKEHPAITALMGLGLSWLLTNSFLRPETAGEKIEDLREKAEEFAESKAVELKETAMEAEEMVSGRPRSVLDGISDFVDENPLIVGAVGISAGLILGLLTSGVLRESGFIDETRRTVKTKTRQILSDTKEKAGHVIDAARQAAREEAERQHLMPH